MDAGRAFRGTQAGGATDLFDTGQDGIAGVMLGAKLTAAAAAATAQLTDGDGTVLVDLSCAINGADYADIPVIFRRKVRLAAITGAGAAVNVWIK